MANKLTKEDLKNTEMSKDYNSIGVYRYIVDQLIKPALVKAISKAYGIRTQFTKPPKTHYGSYNTPPKRQSKSSAITL